MFSPFSGGSHTHAQGESHAPLVFTTEGERKHETYNLRSETGTRNVANGRVVPVVANSYAAIGPEAVLFFQHANLVARRCGRSCADERLEPFVQHLAVFFVASGVLDAFTQKSG